MRLYIQFWQDISQRLIEGPYDSIFTFKKQQCSGLTSVAVINIMTQRVISFARPDHSPSRGSQGRNSSQGRNHRGKLLTIWLPLIVSVIVYNPGLPAQGWHHTLGVGPLALQGNSPPTCPHVNLVVKISQLKFSLPKYVKFDN